MGTAAVEMTAQETAPQLITYMLKVNTSLGHVVE